MKRLLLATVMACGTLAGCGDDDEQAGGNGGEPAQDTGTATAQAGGEPAAVDGAAEDGAGVDQQVASADSALPPLPTEFRNGCPEEGVNFTGLPMQQSTDTDVLETFVIPDGGGVALVYMGVWGESTQSGNKRMDVSACIGDQNCGASRADKSGASDLTRMCAQTLSMQYFLPSQAGTTINWSASVEPQRMDTTVLFYNFFFLTPAMYEQSVLSGG